MLPLVRCLTRDRAMPKGVTPRPLRVLVADDGPEARGLLRMLLILLGHAVTDAADGAAAVEAPQSAREVAPDRPLLFMALSLNFAEG